MRGRALWFLLVSSLLLMGADPMVVQPAGERTWALTWQGKTYRCSVGRNGIAPAGGKREGDGRTPAGTFPLRGLYYRADKLGGKLPRTGLAVQVINRDDGWCDAPGDANYNRPVKTPYPASHEVLWREQDDLYDLIVPIGYNDAPVVPGLGSAIFLHVARPDYAPTAGCVALSRRDLLELLASLGPDSRITIRGARP